MSDRVEVYGTVSIYEPGVIPTDHVDRIHGLRVGRSPDGQPQGIEVQFDSGDHRKHLTIPKMEALALLSFLKAFQLNEDLPFPEDPRNPNWKASDYKKK
ncbi:hypothetical protein BrevBR_13105 [Brevundimonas sp. BR2-1]|uniref:hypothetical protein n=1 Tax=Brevundimonas sp. BR2-1 TaxID=3031123 RepID=UPI003096987A